MGLSELSGMFVGGTRKGPLLMAKQDRFHQVFGDRAAIDCDKGLAGAVRYAVHGPRDHLLTDAAFAKDEDGDRGLARPFTHPLDGGHGPRSADQFGKGQCPRGAFLEAVDLAMQLTHL